MYIKYNLVLRTTGAEATDEMKSKAHALCKDNTYATTLQVLNSTIIKLSKLTVPDKVYRGIAGGVLPDCFWHPTEKSGAVGGVEVAFMSASMDRNVALTYARSHGKAPMLLELSMGMIDRGAQLSWLSQYPGEREVLFAPLCGLEMLDTRVEAGVLVASLRISINLTTLPIEATLARMQRSHLDLCDLLLQDLHLKVPDAMLVGLSSHRDQAAHYPPEWFNLSQNFDDTTKKALKERDRIFEDFSRGEKLKPIWEHERVKYGDAKCVRRMTQCAELCARAGKVEGALVLLEQSLQYEVAMPVPPQRRPSIAIARSSSASGSNSSLASPSSSASPARALRLQRGTSRGGGSSSSLFGSPGKRVSLFTRRQESHDRVESAAPEDSLEALLEAACKEASLTLETPAQRRKLQLAQILIEDGALPPWPPVVVKVCEDEPKLAVPVAILMKNRRKRCNINPFATGARVSVWDTSAERFVEAKIVKAASVPRPGPAVLAESDSRPQQLGAIQEDTEAGFEVELLGEARRLIVEHGRCFAVNTEGDGAVLRAAAEMGMAELVHALLQHGVSPFEVHAGQVTALHEAARAGHPDTCRILIDFGAHPFQEDARQRTPHSLAISGGHSDVRRALEPSASDFDAAEALMQWTNSWHDGEHDPSIQRVEEIDSMRLSLQEEDNQMHCRGLSIGQEGRLRGLSIHPASTMKQMGQGLWHEMDPEPVAGIDPATFTPLMRACRSRNLAEVRRLLDAHPSSASAVSRRGCTALTMAVDMGFTEIAAEMLRRKVSEPDEALKDGTSALMLSCRYGHATTVELLIEHGASVNAKSTTNNTALIVASGNGFEQLAKLLIDNGAELRCALATGWTPLHCAADGGFGPVVRLLLEHNADSMAATKKKKSTPLILAARKGNLSALSAMLEQRGVDCNHARTDGTTALMSAARNGHDVSVRRLLKAGADPTRQDKTGATALCYAAAHGHKGVLKALCDADASRMTLNLANKSGLTPLMLAAKNNHVQAVEVLVAAHCDVDASYERALGRKWRFVGSERPVCGEELIHDALSAALPNKIEFTVEELETLALRNLQVDSFVKVGDEYFEQAVGSSRATALVLAVEAGHEAVAQQLRAAGATEGSG